MQDCLPGLSSIEAQHLKRSLRQNGHIKIPILALPDGRIIDGHHRQKYTPRDREIPIQVLRGVSEEDALAIGLAMNMARRQLTAEQLVHVHEKLQERREVQRKTALELRKQGHTQAQAAAKVGVTQGAVKEWEKGNKSRATNVSFFKPDYRITIPRSARAEIVKRAKKEKAETIAADYKVTPRRIRQIVKADIERRDADERIEAISKHEAPDFGGLYDVLVIDPPWPMKKIEREVRPNQQSFDYPVMTEDELRDFKPPMKANCHVWLWTTHRFLPLAFELLSKWTLKYVCAFVWHKPGGFQPVGLPQYNCEFALYARRGSPIFAETKRFSVCFEAARREHSAKPDEFYEMVRRVTSGRRIDMFARRDIEGFKKWGNQV